MISKSLLAIEVISTAFSYKIINEILENSWLELIEISSASNAKNIFVFQSQDSSKMQLLKDRLDEKFGQPSRRVLEVFAPQLYDICFIPDARAEILMAMTGQLQNPVGEALVIFESQSICAVLTSMQLALQAHSLKICDLRLLRSSGGMNTLFLSGTSANCEQAAAALQQHLFSMYLVGHVEWIPNPNARLKELFSFEVVNKN